MPGRFMETVRDALETARYYRARMMGDDVSEYDAVLNCIDSPDVGMVALSRDDWQLTGAVIGQYSFEGGRIADEIVRQTGWKP